jgi:hypothetical protein
MKVVSFIEDRRVVERLLWHLDLLAELSRGPPSDDFVYQPFYDDLPVVERRTSSTTRSERSKSLRRPTPAASEPMSPKKPKGRPRQREIAKKIAQANPGGGVAGDAAGRLGLSVFGAIRERRRDHGERLDPTSSIPDCACCRVSDLS